MSTISIIFIDKVYIPLHKSGNVSPHIPDRRPFKKTKPYKMFWEEYPKEMLNS
jgi:hypothetical protein